MNVIQSESEYSLESSTCYLHIKDHITIVTRKKINHLYFLLSRKYTAENYRKKENFNFLSNVIKFASIEKGHDFIIVRGFTYLI